MSIRGLACVLLALTFTAPISASAQEPFYKGRQLQMFVGFAAGGPNDIWTRIVGHGMTRHLPGNPTLVVQAMPGAGSLRLTNYLANVAPKDGTQLGMIARGIPFEPLFGGQGIQFDPLALAYIGSPAVETTVCAVRSDLAYASVDDFFTRETIVGTGGGGSETNLAPLTLKNVLGMKFKIIAGFGSGGTDVALAVERKELDGICISYTTLSNLSLYRSGGIKERLVISETPSGALKNVPSIYDREMSERQRKMLRVTFAREVLGRPIVGPPGMPEERVAALRNAFDAAMQDSEVIAEARKANFDMSPTPGRELQKHVEEIYATTPPDLAAEVAKIIGN